MERLSGALSYRWFSNGRVAMTSEAVMSKDEIIAFLDDYRAGERSGEMLFHAWVAACKVGTLRGALRMMELRERAHADLLEQRLKELGGRPVLDYTERTQDFIACLGARDKSDAEKLREFMRIAPPDAVINDLTGKAARLGADAETQALIRTIIEDERATLYALHAAATSGAYEAAA
jgi:hypothetical protein